MRFMEGRLGRPSILMTNSYQASSDPFGDGLEGLGGLRVARAQPEA